jgi:hypothetical protein
MPNYRGSGPFPSRQPNILIKIEAGRESARVSVVFMRPLTPGRSTETKESVGHLTAERIVDLRLRPYRVAVARLRHIMTGG